MKILQLNIWAGRKINEICEYIDNEDFDFLTLQELGGGTFFQLKAKYNTSGEVEKYPSQDCFFELKKRLKKYNAEIVKFMEFEDGSYWGIGIFYKKEIKKLSLNTIKMYDGAKDLNQFDEDASKFPYIALSIKFKIDGKELEVTTGHFLWRNRPYDSDENIIAARKVYDYLRKLKHPFILTGDFNVGSDTVTVRQFENISRDLVIDLKIKNTLNPNLHKVNTLFPEGIACDHMFVSPKIEVNGFDIVKNDFSDHYGLNLDFDIVERVRAIGGL